MIRDQIAAKVERLRRVDREPARVAGQEIRFTREKSARVSVVKLRLRSCDGAGLDDKTRHP